MKDLVKYRLTGVIALIVLLLSLYAINARAEITLTPGQYVVESCPVCEICPTDPPPIDPPPVDPPDPPPANCENSTTLSGRTTC